MGLFKRKSPGSTEKAAASPIATVPAGQESSATPSLATAANGHSSLDDSSKKQSSDNVGLTYTANGDEKKPAQRPNHNNDAFEKETSVIIGPNTTVPVDEEPAEKTAFRDEDDSRDDLDENAKQDATNTHEDAKKGDGHAEIKETNDVNDESPTETDPEDETQYPSGLKLAVLSFGLCLAIFVVALDNTIIATAIPRITSVFDSLDDVGWYGSAYLLTTTSLQPSFGKVYTYMDVKYTYLAALVIFEVGSVLCAAATSSKMLIVGRAVAGAGAAALFSGGMTIIGFAVPLRKRPFYIALLSSMFGISSIVGPILGGALTDRVTWRWCFWINLPFGGVAIAVVGIFFKNPTRRHTQMTLKQKIAEVDLVGAFLLICAIVCLLLALQWGGTTYPWHDSKVWGCILGFALILIVFLVHQTWRGDRATIPPRIFLKQRTVFACAWFSAFLAMGLYIHVYYLPIYFQAVKGTTAEGSGIRLIAYLVSNTILAIIVGGTITAIGYYVPFMWIAAVVFAIGSGLLTTLKVNSSRGVWIGYQILTGAGSGIGVQIPFTAVQVVLSAKDMPSGNAITIFFNTLGGAVSISAAQNIFLNKLIQELPKYAPDVNPQVVVAAGATHIREVVTPQQLPGVLAAYDKAVTTAFILPVVTGGICFLFSLLMEWRSVKGKKIIAAGGA
ncbi:MAG: hypothetical protein M1822_007877 [Bathelium mastoideum]|nr:MAG: hypothetical protein M1822_007877 [Bathelium mastoideum]